MQDGAISDLDADLADGQSQPGTVVEYRDRCPVVPQPKRADPDLRAVGERCVSD